MASSNRVIYSPVTRSSVAAIGQRGAHEPTSLKYLDEPSSDNEDTDYANQRIELEKPEADRNRNRNQRRRSQSRSQNEAEWSPARRLTDNESERASFVEEVYLCSCCGTTKPLDPAMEFVPVFRSLFLLFNCLALALALAQVGLGLWFRIDPKVYELHHHIETQNFTIAGWLMLATGLVVSLLALCACNWSAKPAQSSICSLTFYSICIGLCTMGAIGTLVLLTVYGLGDSLERFLTKEVYEQMRRRTMSGELLDDLMGSGNLAGGFSSSTRAAQFIDFVQVKLRCCGALDFRDYQKLGLVIPSTCYTIAANFINAPGCGQALRELFDLRAGLAAGLVAAGVVVQLLAGLLAGLMACSIYNHRANPRPASVASLARPGSRCQSSSQARSQSQSPSSDGSSEPVAPVQLQRPIRAYSPRPISRAPSIEV